MVKITWTYEARVWLRQIHDFIAHDNPMAAKKVVSNLIQKTEILKDFPLAGSIYPIESIEEEIRVLYYGHYRIAYRIALKDRIDILGVFHGAMEIHRYIQL